MIGLLFGSCRSLLAAKASSPLVVKATKLGRCSGKIGRQFTFGFGLFGLRPNGKQKKTQTFRRLAEGIPSLVEALQQIAGMAGHDFLRLGDELQTIYSGSTKLARQIVGAISTIESDNGTGILQELQTLVSGSLANLTSCLAEAAGKEEENTKKQGSNNVKSGSS